LGTQYASQRTTKQLAAPSSRGAIMLKTELHNHEDSADPPAAFATNAEIEIADQLRHQLEERYLVPSKTSSPLPAPSSNGS